MSTEFSSQNSQQKEPTRGLTAQGVTRPLTTIILSTITVHPEMYKNSHWFLKGKKAHQEAMNLKKSKEGIWETLEEEKERQK